MEDERKFEMLAARAAGEPLPGDDMPGGPELAELEALCGLLRGATLPASDARRAQVLKRVSTQPPIWRALAAAAAVILVAMVAVLAAVVWGPRIRPNDTLAGGVPPPKGKVVKPDGPKKPQGCAPCGVGGGEGFSGQDDPPKVTGEKPAGPFMGGPPGGNKGEESWLADSLRETRRRKYTRGAKVSTRDLDVRDGAGDPKGASGGRGSPQTPVAKQVDFKAFEPSRLPAGYELSSAKVVRAATSKLGFDLLWIHYQASTGSLLLVQAGAGDDAREALEAEVRAGATLVEVEGTLVLVAATNFEPEALKKLAAELKPVKE